MSAANHKTDTDESKVELSNTSFSEAFRDSQKGETPGQAVGTLNFPTDLETAAAGKALLSPL